MDKNLMGTGAYVQGLFIPKRGNVAAAKKLLEIWAQPKYQALYWAAHPGFPGFKDVDGGAVPKAVAIGSFSNGTSYYYIISPV